MKYLRLFLDKSLVLPVASGLLLGLSFPPFHFGWLAYVALVPFLFAVSEASDYRQVLKLSYFCFLVFNVIVIYWIGGWTNEADPFLMIAGAALVLCHPFFFVVPMLVYHFLRKKLGRISIALFPFIYLSFEHFHSVTEVAFPWLTLGYSQSYNLADIQIATYTGVLGLSLQILLVNSLIYNALFLWMNKSRNARYTILGSLIAAVGLIVLPETYGNLVLRQAGKDQNLETVKAAIIQPNIDPYEKWNGNQTEILERYEKETQALLKNKPLLVVWPETAIPFYILLPQFTYYRHSLQLFLDSSKISLLTGLPLARYYTDSNDAKPSSHYDDFLHQYYDTFNGAALFEPNSKNFQTYGKIVLVPFGERIPYADEVPFLIKPLNWGVGISNWARGKDTTVFKLRNGTTFSAVICYESVFGNYVRQFVERGAEFLVIITNDGWYGKSSGPYQHAQYAVIRAVENRRSIVRAANTGISEFIDPYGRFIGDQTRLGEATTLAEDIPICNQATFYSWNGDWLANIAEFVSAGAILFGLFLKFVGRKETEGL